MSEIQILIATWAAVCAGVASMVWLIILMAIHVYEQINGLKDKWELQLELSLLKTRMLSNELQGQHALKSNKKKKKA